MIPMNKKGQGINAAALVAIIAGLIILYFIFLPASEREKILENKTDSKPNGKSSSETVLLKEFPGRIDYAQKAEDKLISNVYLFESTSAKEIEAINPFYVRNGVLDKKSNSIEFSVDPQTTSNVLLSFKAKKYKGMLTIKLNGETIFENEITSQDVEPVRLKDSLLKKDNTLEFSVSSVGWKFWSTNEYSIENAKITGDLTDTSRQKSQNVFTLTNNEYQNIEQATLKFIPYCSRVSSVGLLEVIVNNREVFSAVPVCDDSYSQPIPTGLLNSGENNIVFKTSKGSYSVEQIKLELKSKETKTTKYFFEINESAFNKISSNKADAVLTIDFAKELETEEKRAELNINGHFISIDQDENIYTKNIDGWAEKGNNYIEIKPKTILDVKEIRVELID